MKNVCPDLYFRCLNLYVGCLDLYFACLDLYFGCLDVYFACLDLYFGCLDLYFGCPNLYFGCLDLYFGCPGDGRDGRAGGRPGRESSKHGEKSNLGTCSWKNEHGNLGNKTKTHIFWKWLPRPNHYAHKICIEILSRTPVSILRDLSPGPQNHMKNSKYSFLAWMSTWISRWRRRRRRPNNSAHLVRPLGYRVQEPNIPCGESLTSI